MRHSSWTLFLVPLAIAAFILIMPGTLKTTNRPDSPSKDTVEIVQEEASSVSDGVSADFGSGRDNLQQASESLYKE